MNENLSRPISRQALGRTAFLGSLYDATTDEFCERMIINEDVPAVAIRYLDENHGNSSYEFDSSISKKLRKLNVDASLSLSILGGLVKSAGATNNYLYTRDKTSHWIDATFIHRSIIRTETMNVSHKEFQSRVERSALCHPHATHVVTSIRWGADVFAQFEAKSDTVESKHTAKSSLKLELNKLLSKFISINPNSIVEVAKDPNATGPQTAQIESGSALPQISFDSNATKTDFNYKITVFGDLIATTCPKSIDELISMLPSITTGLQKTNGGKGRPLEYIMLPIADIAAVLGQELTSDRFFRAVDENVTQEIHSIFDDLDRLRTIIHTITVAMQRCEEFFRETELYHMNEFEMSLIRAERTIRSRIAKMLVKVRSMQVESNELDQLLVQIENEMDQWKSKTKEIERGKLHQKLKYILELKEKNVLPVREPDSLAIVQYRNPKHQLIVLYSSDELRETSSELWINVYFEFLHRILFEEKSADKRILYCYFDYDLNPQFQPQQKKLEVKTYVGKPIVIRTENNGQVETLSDASKSSKVDPLLKSSAFVALEMVSKWQREAKERLNEIFGKSQSRILTHYSPSFAYRNPIFEKLRRNQINILLIGRTQIGKSTLKTILLDPTEIPEPLNGYSRTEFPTYEQYSVQGTDLILNLIDTPGLFQHRQTNLSLPDNQTLIHLIDSYVRGKCDQLHFVCFCLSIERAVAEEDLEVIKVFFNILGPEIRKNACLIITHCESKSEKDREDFRDLTNRNLDLKLLSSQMKQGIFFTGSIHPDDWMKNSDRIYQQFETILNYRKDLLNLLINSNPNPVDLSSNVMGKKITDEVRSRGKKVRK